VVPVGKGLRESNAAMSCQARLQHIGSALKAYYIDERGFPPLAVAVDGDGNPESSAEIDTDLWPGLMVLYDTGYIRSKDSFHCPRDVEVAKGSDEYYQSYSDKDPNAKAMFDNGTEQVEIEVNRYKYMPYRWMSEGDEGYDSYGRRQLDREAKAVEIDGDNYKIVGGDVFNPPDDTTIVTWCEAHYNSYTREGEGQYMVLFWDGTVKSMDGALFRDDDWDPDAAWQVGPDDRAH